MFTFPVCKHPVEYRWFRYRLYIFTDISIAILNTIWGYVKFHSAKRREAAHHQHGTNQESNATCACFQNEQRSIWTSFSCGCKFLHDIFGGSGSHLSGCFGHFAIVVAIDTVSNVPLKLQRIVCLVEITKSATVFVGAIKGLIFMLVSGRVEENSCFINWSRPENSLFKSGGSWFVQRSRRYKFIT